MIRTAVIDNDALINFTHLHNAKPFFHYLQNLFHTVYFPTEVINEFSGGILREPHRGWITERLRPEQGFYRFCTSYDSIVLAMVQGREGIHKGEAEAYAQFMKVNAHLIISDDKHFTKALKKLDSTVRVYSSIHMVCWLGILGYITNWETIIKQLCLIRPFKSIELRQAYLEIAAMLGLDIPKKVISKKCSLSKII